MLRIDYEGTGLKTLDLDAAKAALKDLKNGTGKGTILSDGSVCLRITTKKNSHACLRQEKR